MGVYIKGMELPFCCLACPCSGTDNTDDGDEVWICEANNSRQLTIENEIDRRPEWCPLVELPAADVAEVRHGWWTHERLASTTGGTYPAIRCSICETAVPIFDSFPYCPNCGAKMDESEERHGDICDKCVHGEYCAMATFGGHDPKITACCKYEEGAK